MRVGRLADEGMIRVNRAVLVFLGLAGHDGRRHQGHGPVSTHSSLCFTWLRPRIARHGRLPTACQPLRSSRYPTVATIATVTTTTAPTARATIPQPQKAWPRNGSMRPQYSTPSHATRDVTAMALSARPDSGRSAAHGFLSTVR